jgi:hypothetical protein
MTATTNGGLIRMAAAAAWMLAVALPATEASACTMGDEACPAILRMARDEVSITAEGFVSGERPNYYYEFDARVGQKMTITVVGGNIKTGASRSRCQTAKATRSTKTRLTPCRPPAPT